MKQIHRAHFTTCLFTGILLLVTAAWADSAFGQPGNKVTGNFVREISPEIAWEMSFNAHEAVENKKGRIRPAKGFAMGYRIRPDIPGEPLFWVMAVSCTEVINENHARFAGVIVDHAYPEQIGLPIAFEAYDYAQPGNDVDHLRPKVSGDFTEADCPVFSGECTAFEYAQAFCDSYSDPPDWAYWYVTEGNVRIPFID